MPVTPVTQLSREPRRIPCMSTLYPSEPDTAQWSANAVPSRSPHSLALALAVFLGVFALLHVLYQRDAGGAVHRIFIETVGTQPAAALIRTLTPSIDARAAGSRIAAPGGGINILAGCEGSEVLFLLTAAFCAVHLPLRRRLVGLLLGAALVVALNQCRILALFYAYRANRDLFDLLHTIIAPLVLVGLTGLFFHAWLRHASLAHRAG